MGLWVNLIDVDFSVVRPDCEIVFTRRKLSDLAPLLRIF